MAFSVYTAQTWVDGSASTPLSAARLNNQETGLVNAHLMPAVRVYHNTTQSTANGADTTLTFNSERFDQAGGAASTMHDNSTNPSRLTARYDGVYLIGTTIEFAGDADGVRVLKLKLNNTTFIAQTEATPATAGVWQQALSTVYALSTNDYVEVVVNHNAGAALLVNNVGNSSPEFFMVRVA